MTPLMSPLITYFGDLGASTVIIGVISTLNLQVGFTALSREFPEPKRNPKA